MYPVVSQGSASPQGPMSMNGQASMSPAGMSSAPQRPLMYHGSGSPAGKTTTRDAGVYEAPGTNSHNREPVRRGPECEEECAEDECGEECKDGPQDKTNLACGFDTRPALPLVLGMSTVLGAASFTLAQVPFIFSKYELDSTSQKIIYSIVGLLFGVTLGCMIYAAFADPGQIAQSVEDDSDASDKDDQSCVGPMPKRAHQTWQYIRPVRRYDHYCRWLVNCIGLMNHREFLLMCAGLTTICIMGALTDCWLMCVLYTEGKYLSRPWLFWSILGHFLYSLLKLHYVGPIFRLHCGLVARNELADEWKRNFFQVAKKAKKGKNIPAADLSDDEYNALQDDFIYDPKRNAHDRGCGNNCGAFWCRSRWSPKELGEF